MSTRRALSIAAIITACLLALSACKSNQTQQQSSSAPSSSGGGASGGPSMPSSSPPGGSSGSSGSSGGTASLPGGNNSPSPGSGLPSGGGTPGGSSLPSGGGVPGSSMPSGSSGGSQGSQTAGSSGDGGSGSSSGGFEPGGNGGFEPPGNGGRPGNPGDQAPAGTPGDSNGDGIPDTAQPGTAGDDVDFSESSGGAGAQSREEQVATLDEELEGSMRDYDGRILEERAGVMGRPGEENAEEQLEDFDRSVAYYDEAEEGELSEDVSTAENEAPPPARGQSQGSGSGAPGGIPSKVGSRDVNTPPDDIPCGNNDDVVARQIREAAIQEQDPELREALWEEYRKYKEQAGQGKSC